MGFLRWCTNDPQHAPLAFCGSVFLGPTAQRVATCVAANCAGGAANIGITDFANCAWAETYFCEYRMF
jgi:hypothetical protein